VGGQSSMRQSSTPTLCLCVAFDWDRVCAKRATYRSPQMTPTQRCRRRIFAHQDTDEAYEEPKKTSDLIHRRTGYRGQSEHLCDLVQKVVIDLPRCGIVIGHGGRCILCIRRTQGNGRSDCAAHLYNKISREVVTSLRSGSESRNRAFPMRHRHRAWGRKVHPRPLFANGVFAAIESNAVRLGVRRQQRPVDEVANLSALIEGEWVRGHRERRWGAVSCAAVAKLRGARALEEILKRLNLARRNFSNPYLVSSFSDYIVHLAGWWHPHFSYDPTQHE
jgi:hypothetical protein